RVGSPPRTAPGLDTTIGRAGGAGRPTVLPMGNEGAGEGRRPPSLRRVVVRAAPAVGVLGAAGAWGQPGMTPLPQGYNALESQLTAANVATLAPAWTAAVDDGPVR